MWHRVDLVWTDVSKECIAPSSGWFLALGFLCREDGGDTFLRNVCSQKITQGHVLEDGIPHSHRRENLKPYMLIDLIKIITDF
jgi:hypothetical protein